MGNTMNVRPPQTPALQNGHWRSLISSRPLINARQIAVTLTCATLVSVLATQTALAQNRPRGETDVELVAADGWPIRATFYEPRVGKGKEAPVIVLLTPANGGEKAAVNRRVWNDLARHLSGKGFAVLSVDLRKHGDSLPEGLTGSRASVKARDYQAMVLADMEAVKTFLMDKHHAQKLNVRKLGIAAMGASAGVAAAYSVNDWNKPPWPDGGPGGGTPRAQDVRSLLLISPQPAKGLNEAKSLKVLAPPAFGIAIRIYHSDRDEAEKKIAEKLFKIVDLEGDQFDDVRTLIPGKASGEEFLNDRAGEKMTEEIATYFETTVKDLQEPWQSHKSPLAD